MRIVALSFILSLLVTSSLAMAQKVMPPEQGALFGAYTHAAPGADAVDPALVQEFEAKVGKSIVWSYFANNWLGGEIVFPSEAVEGCKQAGTIPYIRMMPWTEMRSSGADPYYKLSDFIAGVYDEPLKAWAREAKAYGQPIMIEFGPEVNGDWFAWNGRWNGGETKTSYGSPLLPDGPERYRDTYRHIVELFREEGVTNVTWVFHIDTSPSPWRAWWNHAKYYYPGDEYMDWIGLSVFGAQLPTHKWRGFRNKLSDFWPELNEVSSSKPVLIAEFAVIEDPAIGDRKAKWLELALRTIRLDPQFSRVKGISYWNSPGWLPDAEADFRLSSSTSSMDAFKEEIANPFWLGREEFKEQFHDIR